MNNTVEWQSWDVYFGTERMHVASYTRNCSESYVLQCVRQQFPRQDLNIKKQDNSSEPSITENNFNVWWHNNCKNASLSPYAAAKLAWAFLCIK